jgi:hypothetical protein
MPDILRAFAQFRFVVVDHVFEEVLVDPFDRTTPEHPLEKIVGLSLIARESLSSGVEQTMLELTGADPPDDLDDGEAATLAFCGDANAIAAVDEAKGRRICQTRFPAVKMCSTLDLLRDSNVEQALSRAGLSDAVYSALRVSRMRVPAEHTGWIVDLLGPDRIAQCTSLRAHVRRT